MRKRSGFVSDPEAGLGVLIIDVWAWGITGGTPTSWATTVQEHPVFRSGALLMLCWFWIDFGLLLFAELGTPYKYLGLWDYIYIYIFLEKGTRDVQLCRTPQ